MNALFSDDFIRALKIHASLKKVVQKKVDMILENPAILGEPLKGNFRGYYSAPVKKNFIVIYLYCNICRKKGDDKIVKCHDCSSCANDTVKFVLLGTHDSAYYRM